MEVVSLKAELWYQEFYTRENWRAVYYGIKVWVGGI